ncbi:MAG: hypothetical protein K1X94_24745 [Sandaracinaceae bacterium]|nr:hypothetical protein [Sandaracinaceae bacterium]
MARSVRLGSTSTLRELARSLTKLGLVGIALGGLAVGCAPGNPGLVIEAQLAPSDECDWDPTATATVAEPIMDLDPLTPAVLANIGIAETRPLYVAQFAVANHLINRFSTSYPVMADPNTITVTSAEIELLPESGASIPNGFYRTRASGTVLSAIGDQPGRGLVRVDLIPQTVADRLAIRFADALEGEGMITARVVVIGQTQGGTEVRTLPYIMPIQLCYGCLYADRPLMSGESAGCSPGQDFYYIAPGFTRTPACVTSGDCASGLCVLGHCARDEI